MSAPVSIDRESFQKLLASAFAVQESGLDPQSLSAILELQRSIATGEPDVDRTINQVADHARNVDNASGIAIALLRGDRLVYRAGSGSAATYVGRHLTATAATRGLADCLKSAVGAKSRFRNVSLRVGVVVGNRLRRRGPRQSSYQL